MKSMFSLSFWQEGFQRLVARLKQFFRKLGRPMMNQTRVNVVDYTRAMTEGTKSTVEPGIIKIMQQSLSLFTDAVAHSLKLTTVEFVSPVQVAAQLNRWRAGLAKFSEAQQQALIYQAYMTMLVQIQNYLCEAFIQPLEKPAEHLGAYNKVLQTYYTQMELWFAADHPHHAEIIKHFAFTRQLIDTLSLLHSNITAYQQACEAELSRALSSDDRENFTGAQLNVICKAYLADVQPYIQQAGLKDKLSSQRSISSLVTSLYAAIVSKAMDRLAAGYHVKRVRVPKPAIAVSVAPQVGLALCVSLSGLTSPVAAGSTVDAMLELANQGSLTGQQIEFLFNLQKYHDHMATFLCEGLYLLYTLIQKYQVENAASLNMVFNDSLMAAHHKKIRALFIILQRYHSDKLQHLPVGGYKTVLEKLYVATKNKYERWQEWGLKGQDPREIFSSSSALVQEVLKIYQNEPKLFCKRMAQSKQAVTEARRVQTSVQVAINELCLMQQEHAKKIAIEQGNREKDLRIAELEKQLGIQPSSTWINKLWNSAHALWQPHTSTNKVEQELSR